MLNLLTTEEKNNMRKLYRVRFITLALIATLLVAIIGAILLLPSLIASQLNRDNIIKEHENLNESIALREQEDSDIFLKNAVDKLNALRAREDNTLVHNIIATIAENRSPSIKLAGFTYETTEEEGKRLTINGVSETRAGLLSFAQTLEALPAFEEVEFPVSNLAQDSDISFSLSIKGDF